MREREGSPYAETLIVKSKNLEKWQNSPLSHREAVMRYDECGVLFSPKRVKCVVLPEASDWWP
jgi:hypothetical protein